MLHRMLRAAGANRFKFVGTDQDSTVSDSSSPKTLSAMGIGVAASNRVVFACFGTQSTDPSYSISSVTIGGVTATEAATVMGSYSGSGIWYAVVPTGTTADVVIAVSGMSGDWGINVGVGVVYGDVSIEATATDSSDRSVSSLSVSAGSIILATCREQALSPETGAAFSSSPAGVEIVDASTDVVGSSQMLVGSYSNALAGTYTVTAAWDDTVQYRNTIVAVSIAET